MRGRSVRLDSPSLGIMTIDGHDVTTTIPKDAIVSVVNSAVDGSVDVIWGEKALTMFTIDLRERATPIDGLGRAGA
jgi:hypothetical protein